MSFNLLPPIEADKGTATMDLIKEYDLKGAIYLGDDYTDIDAFRAIHAARRERDFQGLAIGIIGSETPENLEAEADFTLNGVGDVELLLKWMTNDALRSS
jgi:trehalose 6-phosphate phosphatase